MRRKHKVGFSRIFAAIIGLILAVQLSGTEAFAQVDLSKNNSITVNVGDNVLTKGLESDKVVLDIYKMADAVQSENENDDFTFDSAKAPAAFQSIVNDINKEGADSNPQKDWDSIWESYAQQATAEAVKALKKKSLSTVCDPVKLGSKKDGLTPGLYLVIARGKDLNPASCFKAIKSKDKKENVLVSIASSKDSEGTEIEYGFSPLMISVPMRDDSGEWIYDLKAYLKPYIRDEKNPPKSDSEKPDSNSDSSKKSSIPTTPNTTRPVKTGDDTQRLPYIIGMSVSGLILLIFVFIFLKKRKNRE